MNTPTLESEWKTFYNGWFKNLPQINKCTHICTLALYVPHEIFEMAYTKARSSSGMKFWEIIHNPDSNSKYEHYSIRKFYAEYTLGFAIGFCEGIACAKVRNKSTIIQSLLDNSCDWDMIQSITEVTEADYTTLLQMLEFFDSKQLQLSDP